MVATVDEAGAGVAPGQRVVVDPWLSCAVRGLDPPYPACAAGDLSLCWRLHDGALAPGIHAGNSADAPGGFAERMPAHRQMLVPVPDEVAVLADPFPVALHAVTRNPPPPGGRAVVYGAGALGTCAVATVRALHPEVEVTAGARWPAQRAPAARLGAVPVGHDPPLAVIEDLARWSPGRVDVVYDTVGAPATPEVGLRVLRARGTIVQLGLSSMDRCEWTPWYRKEARLIGSNAFGIEAVGEVRQHAMAHDLDLVRAGGIDLTGLLTHTFPIEDRRRAFTALVDRGESGAVKVAFDLRPQP